MCKCKSELEAKLTERFKSQQPAATGHHATLTGYAMGIGKESMSMYLVGCMPIELTAEYPVKSTGQRKQKTTKHSMFFTFCPFCGKRYEVES